MGQNIVLFGAGVAILLYFIKKKSRDINGLLFSIAGVSNVQLTGKTVVFTMFVQISNPTPSDYPFFATTISGHAILNGSVVLGSAVANINQYLQSGSKILVPVIVTVNDPTITAGVVSVYSVLTNKGAGITFDGNIDIAGVTFPIVLNYTI